MTQSNKVVHFSCIERYIIGFPYLSSKLDLNRGSIITRLRMHDYVMHVLWETKGEGERQSEAPDL